MTYFLKIAPAVLVLMIAIIQLALQDKWAKVHDRRTKRHRWVIRSLVILMATLTIVTCVILWMDSLESAALRKDITQLREEQTRTVAGRETKLREIAQRAYGIQVKGNFFLLTFLGGNGRPDLVDQFNVHYSGKPLPSVDPEQMRKELRAVFLSTTMLEPSNKLTRNDPTENYRPVAQIGVLSDAMGEAHAEANDILLHYGDTDHELIRLIDELRVRAEFLARLVSTMERLPDGVRGVFENGVPDQYADIFSYYFMKQYECKLLCDSILKGDSNKSKQPTQ